MAEQQKEQGLWLHNHKHGYTYFKIDEDGIHVQNVTRCDGRIIAHEEQVVPFSKVKDLSEGQLSL